MPSTYEKIATHTIPTATASYTFSVIPATYTDLVLVYNGTITATGMDVRFRFNGDTGSNYSHTYLGGNGSAASSGRLANGAYLPSYALVGTSSSPATILFNIQNYANTTTFKTAIYRTSDAPSEVLSYVGLWRNTAAINSITIFPNANNLAVGSTYTLYGIKAA